MIDCEKAITELTSIINSDILKIDEKYRKGPSLSLYKEVISCRKDKKVSDFLKDDNNINLMYKTLIAWDMNSRGAKIKNLDDFKNNIISNISYFQEIEQTGNNIQDINICTLCEKLKSIYNRLELMETNSKLVSNSKLLHFVFPNLLMPIDREHTLNYFYGNTNTSLNKYLEIIKFSYCFSNCFSKQNIQWDNYIDKQEWNTGIPKIIDNAIILKMKGD